ncbi:MAG: amino acid permease, partial [Deltaproteobacteria bacterium]|nr:amino acid permease [Deltaproteobacteria bacterium]
MSLKKELGLIDIFSLATGAMISSGIFILPGIAFAQAGPSVFLSYFIAGLLALTGAFSIVELSSAMPKAGGDYFFITRSLGPMFGTVSGMLSWFALSLKTAFAIIGIGEIMFVFWGVDVLISSMALTLFFVLLNIVGVKEAGKFEVLIVMGLLAILLFHVVLGLPNVKVSQFEPFAPLGVNALFLTAGFVFVAYGGLLKVASVAEEVKNPKRNIPAGIFLSLFVTTILYSLITLIAVGTVPPEQLAGSLTPIADSAFVFMGTPGRILLTVAALLAFVSTGNAGIMAASRYPYALGTDRLLPGFFSKVLPKSGTPVVAVALTGLLISLSFFLTLDLLVKVASTVVIVTYILSQISIIILRESGVQNYRPSFKAPLYPWIQLISIGLFILLLLDMGQTVMLISLGFVFVGVLFYFVYGRLFNSSEYALLHILRRITNKKIGTPSLSRELKEILHERDEVTFDRFDHLVNSATVIDLEGAHTLDKFITVVAKELADITGRDEGKM